MAPETVFALTVRVYGTPARDCVLYEDDGFTYDFERGARNRVTLHYAEDGQGAVERAGDYSGRKYEVSAWKNAAE